jgi:hypothetical protein
LVYGELLKPVNDPAPANAVLLPALLRRRRPAHGLDGVGRALATEAVAEQPQTELLVDGGVRLLESRALAASVSRHGGALGVLALGGARWVDVRGAEAQDAPRGGRRRGPGAAARPSPAQLRGRARVRVEQAAGQRPARRCTDAVVPGDALGRLAAADAPAAAAAGARAAAVGPRPGTHGGGRRVGPRQQGVGRAVGARRRGRAQREQLAVGEQLVGHAHGRRLRTRAGRGEGARRRDAELEVIGRVGAGTVGVSVGLCPRACHGRIPPLSSQTSQG